MRVPLTQEEHRLPKIVNVVPSLICSKHSVKFADSCHQITILQWNGSHYCMSVLCPTLLLIPQNSEFLEGTFDGPLYDILQVQQHHKASYHKSLSLPTTLALTPAAVYIIASWASGSESNLLATSIRCVDYGFSLSEAQGPLP